MLIRCLRILRLLVLCVLPAFSQPPVKVEGKLPPTAFLEQPLVLGAEVARQWQGLPLLVNGPQQRTRAYPGQRLTIAVGAQGEGRDALLKAGTYTFTLTFQGAQQTFTALHPRDLRRMKAEGADMVLAALQAAQVEAPGAEAAVSMVSLALFDVDWQVPVDASDGLVTMEGQVSSPTGGTTRFKAVSVDVWSFARVAKDGGFPSLEATSEWMMHYYQQPEPSRLLHVFRLSMDDPNAFKPNVLTFYAQALKADPAASRDLLARLKGEPPAVRFYGLVVLKEAGLELQAFLATLPQDEQAAFKLLPTRLQPLPDPYDLSARVEDPSQVPMRMDMLWSTFLATGYLTPVRAIAGVLAWREDGKAFQAVRTSGKKVEKITLELVRGLAYMASGWSLGSFYRNHPLVTDHIEAWKRDATLPLVIREELGTLLTNPAFRRP